MLKEIKEYYKNSEILEFHYFINEKCEKHGIIMGNYNNGRLLFKGIKKHNFWNNVYIRYLVNDDRKKICMIDTNKNNIEHGVYIDLSYDKQTTRK